MAVMHEGLVPDVSLGTHFFNDLVEMDMVYLAAFPEKEGNQINFARFTEGPNRLVELIPEAADRASVVKVINGTDLSADGQIHLYADSVHQRAVCYVGHRSESADAD